MCDADGSIKGAGYVVERSRRKWIIERSPEDAQRPLCRV